MRHLPLLLLAACGSSKPPSPQPAPAQGDSTLPPFPAAQIRDALEVGLTLRYRITEEDKTTVQEWKVSAADADGCTLHVWVYGADGKTLIADTGDHTSKWTELESHAVFPAALTTRVDSAIDVPAGHFDTWLYEVHPAKPGYPHRLMHFSRKHPGPPIWLEFRQDDKVVQRMELLSRSDLRP